MDRLPPFISKFQTQVVSLAQNTRAYFEPSFNRIHIPKNALIRNYLTLAATVGLISGISKNYFSGDPVSRSDAREVAEAWAPYRSVATWYLWRSLDPVPVDY